MINRKQIADGIYLTEAEGPYKTDRLAVHAASPLRRDNLTQTAMLPYVLERGTARLPDMTMLKRRLNALYGANLSTNYTMARFSRVLGGYIEGVDGALIKEGAAVSRQRVELLLDVLFDPYTENGAFPAQWVDVEREKLRETIRAVINDKRDYCIKLLTEAFFSDDERSLPTDGFEEDLDGINGANLYGAYTGFISKAAIEVIHVGSRYEGLEGAILKTLSRHDITPQKKKELTVVAKKDEQKIVEIMDVEQDKLALAFTPGRLLGEEDLAVLHVACGVLGASPTSRLFVNVREKQSLCYYVTSQPSYRSGGGIVIDCGIDHKNSGSVRAAILRELDNLCVEGPSETELQQIKLLYRNVLRGVMDSSGALANYFYANIVKYGRPLSPEEELAEIDRVSAEQVRKLLGEMHLNTSCLISAREES